MAVATGMLIGTALASAGAQVGGAALASRGAKKAAQTQVDASREAASQLERMWGTQADEMRRLQTPFIQPGQQAAATLGRLLTPGMSFGPSAAPYLQAGQRPETYRTNPFMGAFDRPGSGRQPPIAPPVPPYGTAGQQIQDAYQMYLGRTPSPAEIGSQLGGGSAIAPQNVQFALNNIRTSPEAMAYQGQAPPPSLPPPPGVGINPFLPRFRGRGGF